MQDIKMKIVATRWLSKQEFVLIASKCDKIRGEWSNWIQSGAESLDTVATWWQEVSILSSLPKNHPGLKVRQAKNTNILLPNIEKV